MFLRDSHVTLVFYLATLQERPSSDHDPGHLGELLWWENSFPHPLPPCLLAAPSVTLAVKGPLCLSLTSAFLCWALSFLK